MQIKMNLFFNIIQSSKDKQKRFDMFCKFRGKNFKRIKEILEKEVLDAAEFYKFNDILDCAFAVDDSIKSEN